MAKERMRIPEKTRQQVLKEYSHLCAMCGGVGPQLHHIDEDPSNNDPMNLIPLCANHHLTDQHNPTRRIETGILRLFRQYKDPVILTPQFYAVFVRTEFFDWIDDPNQSFDDDWLELVGVLCLKLVAFLEALEMGDYYSKEVAWLLLGPEAIPGDPTYRLSHARYDPHYAVPADMVSPRMLRDVREEVYELLVEMLRFQDWHVSE